VFNKTSKPQNRIDSLIGVTTRIEGNVMFSGGLRVDGMVRGNIAGVADQPATLVVSADARIDGEVHRDARTPGGLEGQRRRVL
jgi:cytoskeletal protein CcmA (bactofilin family)